MAENGESRFSSAAADRNNNEYVCYDLDNGQARDDNQNKQPGEESPPDGGPAEKPEFNELGRPHQRIVGEKARLRMTEAGLLR